MFILEGKLTFINIEQSYLKKLHDACSEVYYKPSGYEKKSSMAQGDIWVAAEEDDVKHILSVMDIKKMIPIVDGVYSRVNINPDDTDTNDVEKYKDLLNKEYSFCLKVIDEVIGRANKLYDKQMATGKVVKFCCDFKALEEVADK